ncbi:MAG: hypothetical protein HZB18_05900 [Chloroflexi bacterium]|nr:hypothetical protein [Chloroflexota bacterium]
MQKLKEKNPLLVKLLAVVLLVLLCCNLPTLLFWSLCLKEDIFRPFNTKILISACNKDKGLVGVTVTPDGKALFVTKASPDSSHRLEEVYLLDLSTGEKRDVPVEDPFLMRQGELLSSELFWWWGDPDYIIDLNDGQRYDLINLNQMPRLEGNKFDPKYYAYFQSAEQVFILQESGKVIALSPDFRQNPDGNVIYFLPSGSGAFGDGKILEKLMNDLGVKYKIVDFSYPYFYDTDLLSPTGKYIVWDNGIYLSQTFNVVLKRDMSDFQGWYYDESAVVLRRRGYYLIDITFESSLELFYIPGPTLKLRLPAP